MVGQRSVTVEFDHESKVLIQVLGGKGRIPPTVVLTQDEAVAVAQRIIAEVGGQ